MMDVIKMVSEWCSERKPFAIATVVETWRSSPRPVGSMMLIRDHDIVGSVSGGCIEGAVVKAATDVVQSGTPKLLSFGVSNDDAWSVGLTCGGAVSVWLEAVRSDDRFDLWSQLCDLTLADVPVALLRSLTKNTSRILRSGDNSPVDVEGFIKGGSHQKWQDSEGEWFMQVFPSRRRLLMIGAAHISGYLVQMAADFDFSVDVIDPREIFVHQVGDEDQVTTHVAWPQEVLDGWLLDHDTYAVVLSHDPKIDDEALKILLPSEVRYIGALGSKKTHAKRVERLKSYGFSKEDITKISAPVGLDINAKTPQEIALSIISEIVQVANSPRP